MRKWITTILLLLPVYIFGQYSTSADSITDTKQLALKTDFVKNENTRKWIVGSGTTVAYGGTFFFLNESWYKDYPRGRFHTFNDMGEWLQIDKVGHVWTAYQTSRVTTEMWKWAGVSQNNAVLLGTGGSLLYMLSIEYLDGRSTEWGWSWGDVGADLLGAALYSTQQLSWGDQKIHLKFSSFYKNYEPSLKSRANQLFGNSFQGRLFKDYNAQTYWLSFNINSFFPKSKWPEWLNIAFGYGAENMYGGYENIAYDKTGNISFDRRDINRYRQWYLSPDVDLTKIKTRSKFLKTAFVALNVLKFPAPAIEFSNGKFKLNPFSY